MGSITVTWDDQYKQDNVMWNVPRNIRLNDNIVVREDEMLSSTGTERCSRTSTSRTGMR